MNLLLPMRLIALAAAAGALTTCPVRANTAKDALPLPTAPCPSVCDAPADSAEPSWIFRRSTFTNDPATGARVAQYMRKPPVEPLDDPRAITSRYTRRRTNLRGTNGSLDTYYEVQSWGNGRGGIDAEWERVHDAWKDSYLMGGYYNQGPWGYGGQPGGYGRGGDYGQPGYGFPGGGYGPGYGPGGPGYGYPPGGPGGPGYGGYQPGYGQPPYMHGGGHGQRDHGDGKNRHRGNHRHGGHHHDD